MTPIQIILIAGLSACLLYALLQRRRSRTIGTAISLASLAGVYFVLFPDQTTRIARILGVGRGTDLILYCWITISIAISVNLRVKILALEEQLTELTRELALRAPCDPRLEPSAPAAPTTRFSPGEIGGPGVSSSV